MLARGVSLGVFLNVSESNHAHADYSGVSRSTLAMASKCSFSITWSTAIRDVGVSVNQSARCPLLKERVLYAYDAEVPPDSDECELTRKYYGLASIISTTGKEMAAPEPAIVGVLSRCRRSVITEDFASLTHHFTSLRSEKYAKRLVGRFSLRTHWYFPVVVSASYLLTQTFASKLLTGIISTATHNADLEALVTDVMYARGPINETIDVLERCQASLSYFYSSRRLCTLRRSMLLPESVLTREIAHIPGS